MNMLKSSLLFLFRIILSKKVWSLPKKNDLIILDEEGSQRIIDFILGHDDCIVFEDRKKTINIPILFLSIFNFLKYKNYSYRVTYIKYTEAKFAITYIDTRVFYSDILSFIPNCKLAFIQNGNRTESWNFWMPKDKKFFCDYYFTHQKSWSKFASKYLKSNYIESGHIAANSFKVAKHKDIKRLQIVSEFGDYKYQTFKNKTFTFNEYFRKPAEFSLNVIERFCIDNNIKLEIIGCSIDKYDKELAYYNSLLTKFDLLRRKNEHDSHRHLSNDAIICAHNSTLLHEAFGRGFRTAFFSIRGYFINEISFNFGWPEETADFGSFWANKPDKDQFNRILNYLFYVKETEWQQNLDTYKDYIMDYDYKNTIIKNVLKKEGLKIV